MAGGAFGADVSALLSQLAGAEWGCAFGARVEPCGPLRGAEARGASTWCAPNGALGGARARRLAWSTTERAHARRSARLRLASSVMTERAAVGASVELAARAVRLHTHRTWRPIRRCVALCTFVASRALQRGGSRARRPHLAPLRWRARRNQQGAVRARSRKKKRRRLQHAPLRLPSTHR